MNVKFILPPTGFLAPSARTMRPSLSCPHSSASRQKQLHKFYYEKLQQEYYKVESSLVLALHDLWADNLPADGVTIHNTKWVGLIPPAKKEIAKRAIIDVILDKIVSQAPEKIDLESRDHAAPHDGSGAHKM